MSIEEENPNLRKYSYREEHKDVGETKKKKGIIETLKAATTEHELAILLKTLDGYAYASPKTTRKCFKITRKKRVQFKKN